MTFKSNDYYEGVRAAIAASSQAWLDQPPAVHRDSCMVHSWRIGHDAIEALLPKSDPAKALVDAWQDDDPLDERPLSADHRHDMESLVRFIIRQGIIDPDKVK